MWRRRIDENIFKLACIKASVVGKFPNMYSNEYDVLNQTLLTQKVWYFQKNIVIKTEVRRTAMASS